MSRFADYVVVGILVYFGIAAMLLAILGSNRRNGDSNLPSEKTIDVADASGKSTRSAESSRRTSNLPNIS